MEEQVVGEENDVRIPDDREQAREQRKEVASGQDGVAEGGLDAPVGFRFPLGTKRREKQRETEAETGLAMTLSMTDIGEKGKLGRNSRGGGREQMDCGKTEGGAMLGRRRFLPL